MHGYVAIIMLGVLFIQNGLIAQTQTGKRNPYSTVSGNPYQGQEYQMQKQNQSVDLDFPTKQIDSQGEETFMREAEKRYQTETKENLNMIKQDRMMMEREYDPNQTFNYGQSQTASPQEQTHIYYPINPIGPETEIFNHAEARLRGQSSNQQRQYQPESFSNPYGHQTSENQITIPEN